jgi:hypothetical protein
MKGPVVIACSALVGLALSTPPGASAQLDLRAPPGRQTQPRLFERYLVPPDPPSANATRFVAPLSWETQTGRAGTAFFTPQHPPVGPGGAEDPDRAGWLGFGFVAERGGAAKRTGAN